MRSRDDEKDCEQPSPAPPSPSRQHQPVLSMSAVACAFYGAGDWVSSLQLYMHLKNPQRRLRRSTTNEGSSADSEPRTTRVGGSIEHNKKEQEAKEEAGCGNSVGSVARYTLYRTVQEFAPPTTENLQAVSQSNEEQAAEKNRKHYEEERKFLQLEKERMKRKAAVLRCIYEDLPLTESSRVVEKDGEDSIAACSHTSCSISGAGIVRDALLMSSASSMTTAGQTSEKERGHTREEERTNERKTGTERAVGSWMQSLSLLRLLVQGGTGGKGAALLQSWHEDCWKDASQNLSFFLLKAGEEEEKKKKKRKDQKEGKENFETVAVTDKDGVGSSNANDDRKEKEKTAMVIVNNALQKLPPSMLPQAQHLFFLLGTNSSFSSPFGAVRYNSAAVSNARSSVASKFSRAAIRHHLIDVALYTVTGLHFHAALVAAYLNYLKAFPSSPSFSVLKRRKEGNDQQVLLSQGHKLGLSHGAVANHDEMTSQGLDLDTSTAHALATTLSPLLIDSYKAAHRRTLRLCKEVSDDVLSPFASGGSSTWEHCIRMLAVMPLVKTCLRTFDSMKQREEFALSGRSKEEKEKEVSIVDPHDLSRQLLHKSIERAPSWGAAIEFVSRAREELSVTGNALTVARLIHKAYTNSPTDTTLLPNWQAATWVFQTPFQYIPRVPAHVVLLLRALRTARQWERMLWIIQNLNTRSESNGRKRGEWNWGHHSSSSTLSLSGGERENKSERKKVIERKRKGDIYSSMQSSAYSSGKENHDEKSEEEKTSNDYEDSFLRGFDFGNLETASIYLEAVKGCREAGNWEAALGVVALGVAAYLRLPPSVFAKAFASLPSESYKLDRLLHAAQSLPSLQHASFLAAVQNDLFTYSNTHWEDALKVLWISSCLSPTVSSSLRSYATSSPIHTGNRGLEQSDGSSQQQQQQYVLPQSTTAPKLELNVACLEAISYLLYHHRSHIAARSLERIATWLREDGVVGVRRNYFPDSSFLDSGGAGRKEKEDEREKGGATTTAHVVSHGTTTWKLLRRLVKLPWGNYSTQLRCLLPSFHHNGKIVLMPKGSASDQKRTQDNEDSFSSPVSMSFSHSTRTSDNEYDHKTADAGAAVGVRNITQQFWIVLEGLIYHQHSDEALSALEAFVSFVWSTGNHNESSNATTRSTTSLLASLTSPGLGRCENEVSLRGVDDFDAQIREIEEKKELQEKRMQYVFELANISPEEREKMAKKFLRVVFPSDIKTALRIILEFGYVFFNSTAKTRETAEKLIKKCASLDLNVFHSSVLCTEEQAWALSDLLTTSLPPANMSVLSQVDPFFLQGIVRLYHFAFGIHCGGSWSHALSYVNEVATRNQVCPSLSSADETKNGKEKKSNKTEEDDIKTGMKKEIHEERKTASVQHQSSYEIEQEQGHQKQQLLTALVQSSCWIRVLWELLCAAPTEFPHLRSSTWSIPWDVCLKLFHSQQQQQQSVSLDQGSERERNLSPGDATNDLSSGNKMPSSFMYSWPLVKMGITQSVGKDGTTAAAKGKSLPPYRQKEIARGHLSEHEYNMLCAAIVRKMPGEQWQTSLQISKRQLEVVSWASDDLTLSTADSLLRGRAPWSACLYLANSYQRHAVVKTPSVALSLSKMVTESGERRAGSRLKE